MKVEDKTEYDPHYKKQIALLAEAILGEGKLPSGLWELRHHIGIRESNNDHDKCAQHHSDSGTGHTGIRKKLLPGINERSPSYYTFIT